MKRIFSTTIALFIFLLGSSFTISGETVPGKTVINGHWNYAKNSVHQVTVNSEGNDVELFINGISFGHGKKENKNTFVFDGVIFQPGDLTAVSYDGNGKEISRQTLHTAGAPAQLIVTVASNTTELDASGEDTAEIIFKVADFQGNVCGADNRTVILEIDGPAVWTENNVSGHKKAIEVQNGTNRAVIRSTHTPGDIKITATAKGLAPVFVGMNSK